MERDSPRRSAAAPSETDPERVDDGVESETISTAGAEAARPAADILRLGVLEDSYSTLRLVMNAFKERGHQVDHFSNLEDATHALSRQRYDALIVSDTMIGGADACQSAIARIRSGPDKTTASIPILALTLRGDGSRRRVLELLGASATLSDPTETRLAAALATALDHDVPPNILQPGEPRVLLLEDSYNTSLLLSDGLVRGGRAVDHFATPDQAISALDEHEYEALVLSQNDQPGQLTCTQLIEYALVIARPGASRPRILVLTDDMDPQNVNGLLRAGAERVLQKRNPSQLGSFILNLLEIKPSAQAGLVDSGASIQEGQPVGPNFNAAPARSRPSLLTVQSFLVIAGALLVGMVVAGGWTAWELFVARPTVRVSVAELGAVARAVPASGNVVSKRQVELAPSLTGQLFQVYANEGELVRKGEVLATLDNREATINVRRAEAHVFRYRTELNLADKALKALREQVDGGASRQVVLDLEAERSRAAAKLRVAQQDLNAAKLALDRFSVVAPFAGVLLQSFAVEGKWVEAGVPIFTLSDLDAREVALRVDWYAAEEVSPGQMVQMTADGALGEEWEEKVLRVVSEPRAAGSAAAASAALVYTTLGEDAPLLQFGTRVNAQVITDSANNTVTVPVEALLLRDGRYYVALVSADRIAFRPVGVGLRSSSKAEIRSGLVPGELVALSAGELQNGQRVMVERDAQVGATAAALLREPRAQSGTAIQ